MDDFKFNCPNCDQHLEANETMVGASVSCPSCAKTLVIPAESEPPPQAASTPSDIEHRQSPGLQEVKCSLVQLQQRAHQITPKYLSLQTLSSDAHRRLSVEIPASLSQHQVQHPEDDSSIASLCENYKTFVGASSEVFRIWTESPPPKSSEVQTRWKAAAEALLDYLCRLSVWIPLRPKRYAFALSVSEGVFLEAIISEFKRWCLEHGGILVTDGHDVPDAHYWIFISASRPKGSLDTSRMGVRVNMSVKFRVRLTESLDAESPSDVLLSAKRNVCASTGYALPFAIEWLTSDSPVFAKRVVASITKQLLSELGRDNWQAIVEPLVAMRRATASAWLVCPRCGYHHLHLLHAPATSCIACGADPKSGHIRALLDSQNAALGYMALGWACLILGLLVVAVMSLVLRPLSFRSVLLIIGLLIVTLAISIPQLLSAKRKTRKAALALQTDASNLKHPELGIKNTRAIEEATNSCETSQRLSTK